MPDSETGQRHDTVTVTEAARRLNVTPDAIRARIRRGTLEAEKHGGTWHVIMPPEISDSRDTPPDTTRDSEQDATGAALVSLVADLTKRNAELAGVAAHWQARAGDLKERLDAIEARITVTDTTATAHDAPGSPESDRNGPARMESPAGDTTAHTTRQAAPGGVLGWLRRLIRG